MSAEARPHAASASFLERVAARLRTSTTTAAAIAVDVGDSRERTHAVLLERVGAVEAEIDSLSGRLPTDGVVLARLVTDAARGLLHVTRDGHLDVHAHIALDQALNDYLPTTLTRYEAARSGSGTTHERDAQLVEALDTLRGAVLESLAAARDDDERALEAQTLFLRTRFTGSDL